MLTGEEIGRAIRAVAIGLLLIGAILGATIALIVAALT